MSASRESDNLSDLSQPVKGPKISNPAEVAVLDQNALDKLAKQLDPQDIEHECELRRELEAVEGRICVDRCEKYARRSKNRPQCAA